MVDSDVIVSRGVGDDVIQHVVDEIYACGGGDPKDINGPQSNAAVLFLEGSEQSTARHLVAKNQKAPRSVAKWLQLFGVNDQAALSTSLIKLSHDCVLVCDDGVEFPAHR